MEMSPDPPNSLLWTLLVTMEKSTFKNPAPFLSHLKNSAPSVSALCFLLTLLHGRAKIQNRCHSRARVPVITPHRLWSGRQRSSHQRKQEEGEVVPGSTAKPGKTGGERVNCYEEDQRNDHWSLNLMTWSRLTAFHLQWFPETWKATGQFHPSWSKAQLLP